MLRADTNFVIFLESGTYTIDTHIETAENHFKGIIANGKIIVDKGVGKLPYYALLDNGGCSGQYGADLQGFFAANTFDLSQHWPVHDSQLNPFNSDLYCDRQLSIAGSLVQFEGDLTLARTFRGCVGGNETRLEWRAVEDDPRTYPNYNSQLSPYVFLQRADFNNSAPRWIKSIHLERVETN